MAVYPLVKGFKLRGTRVNNCGLPQSGASSYVVTDGFVSAAISPQYQDADELEQRNAEGRLCVQDRTPPERKFWNLTLTLCQVNTCLISMFTGWQQELDWDGNAVGFRDQRRVESDYGVALELWAGGKAGTDCPLPTDDSIFEASGTGRNYGYLLMFGTEWVPGDIEVSASVANFTLSGISFAGSQWGLGPWNVSPADAINTPRRLLTPVTSDQHLINFRTPVPPPDSTPGDECCPLALTTQFASPNFYFGGPSEEPPTAVAPAPRSCPILSNEIQSITFTGSTTILYDAQATSALSASSTAANVLAALEALSNIAPGEVTVTGAVAGGPFLVEFVGAKAELDQPTMTAGTPANATITVVQEGGV